MSQINLTKKYYTYPEYIDSGVEWFGNIPAEWKLLPLRAVLDERVEKNKNLISENILSVMKDVGVIRYEDKGDIGNKSSDRPENYKIVRPGDIVLNSMNLVIGSVGQSKELGVTSSVYIIYKSKKYVSDSNYYHYLFKDKNWQKTLGKRLGRGIMELRESIKSYDLKIEPVVVPPLETQKRIAEYLDEKTGVIDKVIEKKERLLELLKEKRVSVINEAIVSADGEKGKLKNYIRLNPSKKILSITSTEDIVSFVPMEAISELGELKLQERKYKDVSSGFTYFSNGDVVLAKITPCYENGKVCVMKGLKNSFGFGTTEFMVMRPGNKILTEYLYFIVFSDKFRKMGEVEMRGTAGQKRVTSSFVVNYELSIPVFKTQQKIVKYLDFKTSEIDGIMQKQKQSILLLKELRSSLISNVVTGKIRV